MCLFDKMTRFDFSTLVIQPDTKCGGGKRCGELVELSRDYYGTLAVELDLNQADIQVLFKLWTRRLAPMIGCEPR